MIYVGFSKEFLVEEMVIKVLEQQPALAGKTIAHDDDKIHRNPDESREVIVVRAEIEKQLTRYESSEHLRVDLVSVEVEYKNLILRTDKSSVALIMRAIEDACCKEDDSIEVPDVFAAFGQFEIAGTSETETTKDDEQRGYVRRFAFVVSLAS